jgi:hypothetical protein
MNCINHKLVLLFLLVGLLGCGSPGPIPKAEDDIRALLVTYMLDLTSPNELCFLEITKSDSAANSIRDDPDDSFVRRFSSHRVQLRKASLSRVVRGEGRIDTLTKVKGTLLWVGPIRWSHEREARVACGTVCGSVCGWGREFIISFSWGRWRIGEQTAYWVL